MKEVVKTIGEIFVGIGMLTSFDVIGVLFISTVLFSIVFLPIILGTEEK